jgi:hypothetical protein
MRPSAPRQTESLSGDERTGTVSQQVLKAAETSAI